MTAAIREHAGKNGKDTIYVCCLFAFKQRRHARVVLFCGHLSLHGAGDARVAQREARQAIFRLDTLPIAM